jgi:hypothetical protein
MSIVYTMLQELDVLYFRLHCLHTDAFLLLLPFNNSSRSKGGHSDTQIISIMSSTERITSPKIMGRFGRNVHKMAVEIPERKKTTWEMYA